MILAAGRGERMRPFSDRTPKPLLEAGGHRLIDYHLAALARCGIREVVINLAWLGGLIRESVGDGRRHGLAIVYSDEGPVALGTGGGIRRALQWLGGEPFLVANGDVWIDLPFEALRPPQGSLAHLVLVPNPEHHPQGDFALGAGAQVTTASTKLTYAGVAVFDPELFAGGGEDTFPLKPLLDRALAAGRLSGQQHAGSWTDVGTPERLARLDAALRGGELKHPALPAAVG